MVKRTGKRSGYQANSIGMYSEPDISHNLVKPGPEPWTIEELMQQVPKGFLQGYQAPAKPNH